MGILSKPMKRYGCDVRHLIVTSDSYLECINPQDLRMTYCLAESMIIRHYAPYYNKVENKVYFSVELGLLICLFKSQSECVVQSYSLPHQ